ncbi:unnamed protein product [Vitrella brassicaformis CCMP3155]|uniref:Uncharacterized protein n=1 Tax=Vitrella brassicaformis (strain CCMP3155) TaxID=1169540 RepID=A0A0G4EM76_VITBC|nr:unnamed protein product [Vitrella brassicaformis CCMP3155]|eukprot:CEL98264.1 unnamed protein product [Vitrella brassicaformis CCMP3155]
MGARRQYPGHDDITGENPVSCLKCEKVMHGSIISSEEKNGLNAYIKCPKNCPIGDDKDNDKALPVLILHMLAVAAAYMYRTRVASGTVYDIEQAHTFQRSREISAILSMQTSPFSHAVYITRDVKLPKGNFAVIHVSRPLDIYFKMRDYSKYDFMRILTIAHDGYAIHPSGCAIRNISRKPSMVLAPFGHKLPFDFNPHLIRPAVINLDRTASRFFDPLPLTERHLT